MKDCPYCGGTGNKEDVDRRREVMEHLDRYIKGKDLDEIYYRGVRVSSLPSRYWLILVEWAMRSQSQAF